MSTFFQVTAAVLLTALLTMLLNKQNKDIALVLTIAVCCMVMMAALRAMEPVLSFLDRLKQTGSIDNQMVKILLKVTGIGLVAQIASMICTDSGNNALGKTIQILASAVILWQSLPLLESLLELVQKILGEL